MGRSSMAEVLLLTGKPGAGKTSLIMQAVAGAGLKAGGFYTEEIRSVGTREGFRIVPLDGRQAVLAHVGISSPFRVSKYGVDTEALNSTAVPAIRSAISDADLIVIDEIGKMDLFSAEFCDAVIQALNSGKRVLGSIMLGPHPFSDRVKRHPRVETLIVSRDDRTEVEERISGWLKDGPADDQRRDLPAHGSG